MCPDLAPDPVSSIAILDEPTRRRLYDYVVTKRRPVSRDDAAAELGLSRTTVAFHLDKLVEQGLLDVIHERRSGRSGPGAGRPAKLYLRSDRQVEVSLPGRRYDLAGLLLAAAVEEADASGGSVRDALSRQARACGEELGRSGQPSSVTQILQENGFEPLVEDGSIRLGNCPFHELAAQHTDLVCGMNLDLIEGVLAGSTDLTHTARLAPETSYCCVVLDPA